jgi:HEAT repeat protein
VLALVQCTDLRRIAVLRHLVDAMTDPADPVRLEAVRALEQMNGDEAGLLLRLKAHLGDRRPIVIGEVFDGLLNLEREQAVEFVEKAFESGNAEVRDEAALALGASRLPAAVDFLINAWNEHHHNQEFGLILLRALSASRQPPALEFLLGLVKRGSRRDAAAALDALELQCDSSEIRKLVDEAKRGRE